MKDPRVEELLGLILDDMSTATNQDLACDGPVGNEEGKVWQKIETLAEKIRHEGEYAPVAGPHGTGF